MIRRFSSRNYFSFVSIVISFLKIEEICVNQSLFKRYVPGLSELLHTSCSTIATASTAAVTLTYWIHNVEPYDDSGTGSLRA